MKQTYGMRTFVLALLFLGITCTVNAEDAVLPRIAIDNAPLLDTIRTLARQASLNIIIDPHVPGSDFEPGRSKTQPNVTVVWTNVTAKAALDALLQTHKLKTVSSEATGVTRIAPVDLDIKPVSADQVAKGGKIVPLIVLDSVPMSEAITSLARGENIDVTIDTRISAPSRDGQVSFRWEKITVRQALAALLDNHDLVMIEDPATSKAQITLKTKKE